MADSIVKMSELHLTDRETEVEQKEHINEESSAVKEGKGQAGFKSSKQDPKKQVKSINEESDVNEGKAEAAFVPPKRVAKKSTGSSAVKEGKAEAAFEPPKPPKQVLKKSTGSSAVKEGKAEAAFEPPKQVPKKQGKRPRKMDGRRTKYTPDGIHKGTQLDLCDCLNRSCPGCWMPCKKCSSTKCGHECRQNRRWEYESIEIQGTSINIKNQFKK